MTQVSRIITKAMFKCRASNEKRRRKYKAARPLARVAPRPLPALNVRRRLRQSARRESLLPANGPIALRVVVFGALECDASTSVSLGSAGAAERSSGPRPGELTFHGRLTFMSSSRHRAAEVPRTRQSWGKRLRNCEFSFSGANPPFSLVFILD